MNLLFLISFLLIACTRPHNENEDSAWSHLKSHWSPDIISQAPDENTPQIHWDSATPFLASVMNIAQEEKVPSEAAIIPFLLSYYNNLAESTPQHRGIWQIKKSNCSIYHLTCNDYYDQRLHPIFASRAVMRRLKTLHQYYRSWETTFNAYYLEQQLFDHHALKNIGSFIDGIKIIKHIIIHPNPIDDFTDISSEPFFESLLIDTHINIIDIAQTSDIDLSLWKQLNSYYLKGESTPLYREILVPTTEVNMIKLPSASFGNTTHLAEKITNTSKRLRYLHQVATHKIEDNPPSIQNYSGFI